MSHLISKQHLVALSGQCCRLSSCPAVPCANATALACPASCLLVDVIGVTHGDAVQTRFIIYLFAQDPQTCRAGCYILRPYSHKIWDAIRRWFDERIEAMGVENCYFPLLITKGALEMEASHVEGFAAEASPMLKAIRQIRNFRLRLMWFLLLISQQGSAAEAKFALEIALQVSRICSRCAAGFIMMAASSGLRTVARREHRFRPCKCKRGCSRWLGSLGAAPPV